MNKYDLSILIPARNEQFVAQTVKSVLEAIRGKTEVIVALDGDWADPAIEDDPRVTIIHFPEAIGQRAATNQACRLSRAKYVMKLDAHCILDEGFDIKLIAEMQDDYTMIPTMYNLHAFDQVCQKCKERTYQGPTIVKCEKCGGEVKREMIWKPRMNRKSNYYRFDTDLHFQYWGKYGDRPEAQGDLVELLTIQGSCFMLTRDKYWELDICEEALAGKTGWGQQGVEVALKTWLSGGKVMLNKKTWYSHMFRTQGGDFGFPYPLSGKEVSETRRKSQDLWRNDKWKGIKPGLSFQWLLEKFAPIPDWDIKPVDHGTETSVPSKEIIFYTDNQLKLKYAHAVQKRLKSIGIPIISASLKPMENMGTNIFIDKPRGLDAYFAQIISALEKSTADIVYMCEHDVVYHPSHFDFIPPTKNAFYYNLNFWRIRPEVDNFAVHWDAPQVSGLVCDRTFLLNWYKLKWAKIQKDGFDRSYEPGGRTDLVKTFRSAYPNIDIRHGKNLTKSKWSLDDFRDKSTSTGWETSTIERIPGWDTYIIKDLCSY